MDEGGGQERERRGVGGNGGGRGGTLRDVQIVAVGRKRAMWRVDNLAQVCGRCDGVCAGVRGDVLEIARGGW